MSEVKLEYIETGGKKRSVKIDKSTIKVELSNKKIREIDLSPLASCPNLQELYLHSNQLKAIDLSPLVSCPNLQKLNLSSNRATTIDLSPLTVCTNLQVLHLDSHVLLTVESRISSGSLKKLQQLCGRRNIERSTERSIDESKRETEEQDREGSIRKLKKQAEELSEQGDLTGAVDSLKEALRKLENGQMTEEELSKSEQEKLGRTLKEGILINEVRFHCAELRAVVKAIDQIENEELDRRGFLQQIEEKKKESRASFDELSKLVDGSSEDVPESLKFLAKSRITEFKTAMKKATLQAEELVRSEKTEILRPFTMTHEEALAAVKAMVVEVREKLKNSESDLNLQKTLTETLVMAVKLGDQHGLSEIDLKEVKALLKNLRQ